MKTIMLLVGMLISFNLAAAAVYEFTQEPATPPAQVKQNQVKSQVKPQAKSQPAKPAAKPATNQTSQAAEAGYEQQDAVAQNPGCAAGAACNDL